MRTSSEVFDLNDLSSITSHLTNHCIQQANSPNYGKYEEGNELFFEDFNRYAFNLIIEEYQDCID